MNSVAASATPPSSSVDPPPLRSSRTLEHDAPTAQPKSVVAASSPRYSAAAAASSFLFQQAAALAAAAQQRKQMQILSRHMVLAAKGAAAAVGNVADSYYDYRDDEASLPPALGPKDSGPVPDPQLLNAFFTSALQAAKQCGGGAQGGAGISPLQAIANMPYPPNSAVGGVGNINGRDRSQYAGGSQNHVALGQDRTDFPHHRLNYHYHPHTSPVAHHAHHAQVGKHNNSNGGATSLCSGNYGNLASPVVANGGGVFTGKVAKNGPSGPSKLLPLGSNPLVRPIAKPHPHHHQAASMAASNNAGPSTLTKAPVNIAPKPPGPPASTAPATPGWTHEKLVKAQSSSSVTITTTTTTSLNVSKSSSSLKYSPIKSSLPPPLKPIPTTTAFNVNVSQPTSSSQTLFGIEKIIESNVSTPAATTFTSPAPVAVLTTKCTKGPEVDQKMAARKRSLEAGSSSPSPKTACKKKAMECAPSINAPLPVKTMTAVAVTKPDVKELIVSTTTTTLSAELIKSDDRAKSACQGNGPVVKVKAKKKSSAKQPTVGLPASAVSPTISKSAGDSKTVVSQTSPSGTLSATPSTAAAAVVSPNSSTIPTTTNLVRVITTAPPKMHAQSPQASTTAPTTPSSTPVAATKISKATPSSLTAKRSNQADTSTANAEFSTPKQGGNHHKAGSAPNAKHSKSTTLGLNGGIGVTGNSIGRYKTVTPAGSNPSTAGHQHPVAAPQQFLFYSPATNQFYSGLANAPLNTNNSSHHNPVGGFNSFYGGLQAMLPAAGGSNPNVIGYATAGPTSALGSGSAGPNGNGTGAVSYLIFNPNPQHNHQAQALPSTPFFHQAALGIGAGSFQTTAQQSGLAAQPMPTAQYKSPGIGSLLNLASLQVGPSQPGPSLPYQNPGPQLLQPSLFYQANSAHSQPPTILPALASINNSSDGSSSLACSLDPASKLGQRQVVTSQRDKMDASLSVAGGHLATKLVTLNDSNLPQPESASCGGDEGCHNDSEVPPGPSDTEPRDIMIHVLDGHIIRESSQPLPLPNPPFRLRFMAKHGFKSVCPPRLSSPRDGLEEGKSNKRLQNQTSVITQGPACKKAKNNERLVLQEPNDLKNVLPELSATVADVSIKSEDGTSKSLIEQRKTTKASFTPTTSPQYPSVIQAVPRLSFSSPFTSAGASIIDAPSTPPYNSSQITNVPNLESPKPQATSSSLTSPTPSNAENQSPSTLFSPQPSPYALFPNGSELTNVPPTAKDIQCWTVSDVHAFISNLSGCREYAETFKTNEIDGPALLLLKEDHLTSALKIKLGPALKIHAKVAEIRANQSI